MHALHTYCDWVKKDIYVKTGHLCEGSQVQRKRRKVEHHIFVDCVRNSMCEKYY